MPEGKKAAEFLRGLLPAGEVVMLVGPDVQLEQDRYQRLLAVVMIPAPEGTSGTPTIVQDAIVRAGRFIPTCVGNTS